MKHHTERLDSPPKSELSDFTEGTIQRNLVTNGRTLEQYESFLMFDRKELEDKRVLDLGAGQGANLAKELGLANIDAEVVSLSPDFSFEEIREELFKSLPESKFVAGVGQALPFADESFDYIFAIGVDDHIHSPRIFKFFISEMARVLKPGGQAKYGPIYRPGYDPLEKLVFSDQELMKKLGSFGVTVVKEFIPKLRNHEMKDGEGFYVTVDIYNIVLKRSSSK